MIVQELLESGRLVWRLVQDNRVPSWVRFGIPLAVVLYLISPVDFIPDFIPGLGQLDDLGFLLLGMNMVVRFAPQTIVDEHRSALGQHSSGSTTGGSSQQTWQAPPTEQGRTDQSTRRMNTDGTVDGEYRVVDQDNQYH